MSARAILDLRASFEAGRTTSHRMRLRDEQVEQLVEAATSDDGVDDAEAIALNSVSDSFVMSERSRRSIRTTIADALSRADTAMRQAQADSYARAPARTTAANPGADLPADVDLLLSGLPVTSYAMPESAYAPVSAAGARASVEWRHPDAHDPSSPMGLRIIPMSRATAARELARTSLVQTGDVLLTVRPEWAGTGAYAAAQMGISHAGFASIRGGVVTNLDMPLTSEYVGSLDSAHYRETTMLHIMRPRGITEEQRANLRAWVTLFRERSSAIFGTTLKFNSDYGTPNYRSGEPQTYIENLARLALGLAVTDASGAPVTTAVYCSEFVYALLALRDLNPSSPAVRRGDFSGIAPLFTPVPVTGTAVRDPDHHLAEPGTTAAGFADGVALAADLATTSAADRDVLVRTALTATGDMTRMSAGHRTIAEKMSPLFAQMEQYYVAADDGPDGVLDMMAKLVNEAALPNYSPAYYFINALLPESERSFDYVGTVVFTD